MKPQLKRAGQIVRRVQVVKVQEYEKWPTGVLLYPARGILDHGFGGAFDVPRIATFLLAQIEGAIVNIKTLRQAKPAIQREATDKSRGPITHGFELRRKRDGASCKLLTVVLDLRSERVLGCEQGDMRWQSEGRLGACLTKQRTARGEPIDIRRGLCSVAVTTEVIGAQRVHRYQYHRLLRGPRLEAYRTRYGT